MPSSFLITGGAGFLGINLIRYLVAKGQQVTSFDIAPFDYMDVAHQVKIIRGDVRDKAAVAKAMKGIDVVVHAAAALPLYTREQIMATNVEGTRNVLEAAFKAGVRRVVYISSTAVYGIPDHHPLYEDDPIVGV